MPNIDDKAQQYLLHLALAARGQPGIGKIFELRD